MTDEIDHRPDRWARLHRVAGFVTTVHGAIVAVSAAVAVVLVPLGGEAVGLVGDSPVLVTITTALGGTAFGTALTLVIRQVSEARRATTAERERGYRVLATSCYYTVDGDDPHDHQRETVLEVRAVEGRLGIVEMVDDRHSWIEASDLAEPVVTSPDHEFVAGSLRRVSGWRSYQVRLRRPLRAGQKTTVTALQGLYDSNEQFEPFLARTVHDRMDELTLVVALPARLRPFQVWRIVRKGDGPYADEERELEKPGEADPDDPTPVTLRWHVTRPTPGWVYELAWDYRDEGAGQSIYDLAYDGG